MRSSQPRVVFLVRNWGPPGSVVVTSVVGADPRKVASLGLSGSDVVATILGSPRADTLDVAITIAAGAAPGPRAVLFSSGESGLAPAGFAEATFYVVAPSGYAGARGIGSHLI